jgi:hypothetical protein
MHFQALSCNGRLPKSLKIRYLASTDGAHNAGVEGSSPSLSTIKSIRYGRFDRVGGQLAQNNSIASPNRSNLISMEAGRPAVLIAWIECESCGRIDKPGA